MSRRRAGERHPNAKLTQQQVDEIRASRMGPSELGRLYGVSKATISLIRSGKLWTKGSAAPTPPPPPVEQPSPVASSTAPAAASAFPKDPKDV